MAIVVPPNSLKLLPQRLSASEKSAASSPNYTLKLRHPILSLLERCASMHQLRQLHAHMITTGLVLDTFAASRLLAFAALSLGGDLHYALAVFRSIPSPNLFIWNAMIRAFSRSNQPQFSLRFYIQMLHEGFLPDSYTFPFLLKSCAHLRAFSEGQQIHVHVLKTGFWGNPFISNSLIHMYSEFGRFELAEILFHAMGESDASEVSWVAMIAGFISNGRPNDAVALFCSKDWKMMNLDQITLTTVLSACAHLQDLKLGIDIHNYIVDNGIELNLILCNSLLNMYVKCGQIGIAEKFFDGMSDKDSISWNILILGLLENGNFAEGFRLFSEMKSRNIRVNEATILILLSSCGELEWVTKIHQDLRVMSFESSIPVYNALIDAYTRNGSLDLGRKVFDEMPNRDIISWNSIIAGYARHGSMNIASQLFDQMPMKDSFSWSTMILGYIRCEQPEQAFDFYKELVNEGITKPDKVTLLGALSACSQLGALEEGKAIHLYIKNNDILIDAALGTALLDMYTKCGCLSEGVSVFEAMTERDTCVWTAMISGLAIHGYGKEALEVFGRMKTAKGDSAEPNSITFLNVLSACSHAGLVEEGWRIYQSVSEYGIVPDKAHLSCMVDLLGRAGHLKEAADLVTNLGAEAGTKVWGALLGACRIHGNLELGKVAYKRILELDPLHEGAHVLMSNIYAEAGEWNESKKIRRKMKDCNISKEVGRSWIEVYGMINVFTAGCGS